MSLSSLIASRTVSRLTENRTARSRSLGSACPGGTTPSRMVCIRRAVVSSSELPARTGRNTASSSALDSTGSTTTRLQGGDVGGADAAVDEERGRRDERGVVAGEEGDGRGELLRLGEASDGHVDQATLGALRVLGEQLLEQRGVHRAGAQSIDADPLAGELDAELARHGEHPSLGCGVRDLRGRAASTATN